MFYKILAPVYHRVFPVEGKDIFLSQCFKSESTLLDIGCSDGRVAANLIQLNRGFHITAIDLSDIGFSGVTFYSGFNFLAFDENKLPLVIVAHKDLTNK